MIEIVNTTKTKIDIRIYFNVARADGSVERISTGIRFDKRWLSAFPEVSLEEAAKHHIRTKMLGFHSF